MTFTDQMASLRTTLNDTKKRTNQGVREVKRDTHEIIRAAQETQKANAKQIREDLERATQDLARKVKEMRGDNIRSQRELKRDFASAHNVFLGKQKIKEEKKEKEEKGE